MTQEKQIYRCNVCGNIVEVLHAGAGQLVCCGENMELLEAKQEDEGREKHVPVIERSEKGVKVKVGSVAHPMEGAHYIEWIELQAGDKSFKKFLNPTQAPEAEFEAREENLSARIYCNVHGLWKSK